MDVRSELLCYSFNYANKSSVGGLTECLVQFYKPEEIWQARELLWHELQQLLNDANMKKTRRPQAPTNPESARPFAEDISQWVHALDPNDLPMSFYAVDLRRIPPCPPEEINVFSLASRLSVLEEKMNVTVDSLSVPQISSPQTQAKMPFAFCPPPQAMHSQSLPRAHKMPSEQSAGISKATYSGVVVAAAASDKEWTHSQSFAKRRNRQAAAVRKYVREATDVRSVIGTGDDAEVKASSPVTKLFVHGVQKPCTADAVKNYLENKEVRQVTVRETSKASWTTASFYVSVDKRDADIVFEAKFWPKDVQVREWLSAQQLRKKAPQKTGPNPQNKDDGCKPPGE